MIDYYNTMCPLMAMMDPYMESIESTEISQRGPGEPGVVPEEFMRGLRGECRRCFENGYRSGFRQGFRQGLQECFRRPRPRPF